MTRGITAIIPAKAISGRLPHKNTLPYGDSNMLINKIGQLKAVDLVKEIIVSSEDDEILQMAESEGARAIKRPYEFSIESKPFQEFLYYIVGEAKEDHVMWACCTSPLVGADIYNKGCELYFEKLNEGYDSLITVMEYHHYLLDSDMKPYTFKWGPEHKNSQELDKLYFFTDGIQLAPKKSMREWKYYFGHNPYGMEVDLKTSTDVDTIYDYLLARMQYYLNEDKMLREGIDAKDGEQVYNFALAKMIRDSDDETLSKIVGSVGKERIMKILGEL